jgi:hypothetical protein
VEVNQGIDAVSSELVHKFNHFLKVCLIVPIFLWLHSCPPESFRKVHGTQSHAIHAQFLVNLVVPLYEGEVRVKGFGIGKIRWHFDHHTSSMDLQLPALVVDKHQVLVDSYPAFRQRGQESNYEAEKKYS